MTKFVHQILAAKSFHHFIVAVIVLAGVVAGLETSPALMVQHGAVLLALDKFIPSATRWCAGSRSSCR